MVHLLARGLLLLLKPQAGPLQRKPVRAGRAMSRLEWLGLVGRAVGFRRGVGAVCCRGRGLRAQVGP